MWTPDASANLQYLASPAKHPENKISRKERLITPFRTLIETAGQGRICGGFLLFMWWEIGWTKEVGSRSKNDVGLAHGRFLDLTLFTSIWIAA